MGNMLGAALFLAAFASDDYCTAHLDHQLAWHREYGLPLPPPQASLVWYVTEPRQYIQNRKLVVEPGSPGLGFSLDGRTVLGGTNKSDPVASITFVKPDPSLIRDGVSIHWLQFAVACHERGWKPMALVAIRQWILANRNWDTEGVIASDAWHHWTRCIHKDPGTPLTLIAKYLKRVQRLHEGDTKLIRSVDLAVEPRKSPVGSDDALIDELVDVSGEQPFEVSWAHGYRLDPRYRALVRRGLDVVPALIAHLEDERITRAIRRLPGLDNIQNLRVKDLALDVLAQLHGGPFVAENNIHAIVRAVGMWFADAHKLGEERYVASCLLGAEEDDGEFRATLFWLLTEKYPEQVPGVYRALIDTRRGQHRFALAYARAVAEGPLPRTDKQKILEYAATQDSSIVRWSGIKYLRTVDPKLAHGILQAALAKLSAEPDASDVRIAMLVAECTDPDEWKALARAVRRADPRVRLELLHAVAVVEVPEGRKRRLAFLAEYLTDTDVCEKTPDFIRLDRIEVRNFAALRLMPLLEIDGEPPDEDWTPVQWSALRDKVRAKVKEELRR